MTTHATKQQRRKLRELAALAHERELAQELGQLEADFRRWRAKELDVHELNDRIHQFHQGPSRKLYTRYSVTDLDMTVASAIVRKVISEAEAGPEITRLLQRFIDFATVQQQASDRPQDEA
jgi:hypothetical protein